MNGAGVSPRKTANIVGVRMVLVFPALVMIC